jgi:protein involved in polysaccharide export with SLBB domain
MNKEQAIKASKIKPGMTVQVDRFASNPLAGTFQEIATIERNGPSVMAFTVKSNGSTIVFNCSDDVPFR